MKSKLTRGLLVPIYQNSQTNEKLLGIGRLTTKKKDGLPFIIDGKADNVQEVWVEEYWKIEWIHQTKIGLADPRKTFPIRTLYSIGLTSSYPPSDPRSGFIQDKFLEYDGKEIF